MKTIINTLRFTLVLGFVALSLTAWSQRANIEKMSISTQMFLDQIENKADFKPQADLSKLATPHHIIDGRHDDATLPFCKPDTIDGKVYMSAFVRISNESVTTQLEAMGVEIQSRFEGGLMTALIPIERIEDVAALAGVSRINAATPMRLMTNEARKASNVDDVLTLSNDATAAGLTKKFDGTGVILGIIDTGIDFNHIAFKDKNGNSRIKRAYVYNGSSAQEYSSITSGSLTDDRAEDHGTHTSSIAGGSSVIVNGSNVTVTDDHANATYGGMAPGSDLYLAGIYNLSNIYLSNAVSNMCNYADQQGKPLVVSNSWGSQIGPHDGTGDVADVYNSLFGDNHPNRVALFAASNDAGSGNTNGEGYHISGTASSANPLGSILRCHYYSDTDDGYYYQGIIANGWSQSGTTTIKCKIYVLNRSTGAVLTSVEVTPTTSGATVSGLGTYYSGTLYAYKDYVSANGKTQIMLYTSGLESRSYNSSYVSNYTLAVEFYPQTGSATIDVWGGNRGYFSNFVTTQGHNWRAGSDDMSVSDEATIPSVISIGAYVTKNQTTSYNGTVTNFPRYTIGDIAYFSSYAIADQSPTGLQYPWITAPGARLVAGVNHNHTTSVDNYSYYGNSYNSNLVVNSSTNPYAAMEGTSMATPAAAGIVALWMQASLEANAQHKNLTVNDVKEIMRETAITDSYTTTGANASHFGYGKINALAGIQYILGLNGGTITVDPTELTFGGSDFWTGSSESKTVVVTNATDEALLLTIAGLNASLSGTPFSVTAITSNGNVAANGGTVTITITYAPTVASASDQATLVIADGVTVALTGSCIQAPEPYDASVYPVEGTLAYGTVTTGNTVTKTITITNEGSQSFTPVVNVSAPFEANYDNSPLAPGESRTITVTFTPTQEGDYSEQLTITASESSDISFNFTLTGTGEAPYIAATVSPQALDFTDRVVGNTYTATVTIANTGTMVFTPVINTDNLPGVYTVSGGGQVAIGGSINLTVTYSPTTAGVHNGSFTVTIGGQTYTVVITGSAAEVSEATVADGTETNYYLPIYGNQYANKQINQMIYPASMLTEIQGKKIKSMKFYSTGLNFSGGQFNVSIGTTTQTTFVQTRYTRLTGLTTVKTGQVAVSGGTELVINFDQPFEYTGNNLVIEFEVTSAGSNSTTSFYGINPNGYTSFNSYGTTLNNYNRYGTGNRRQFLPKVTFEWENEVIPVTAGTVSPSEITFTDTRVGKSDTQTVTITNTGNQPFTPVIDTTNLPGEFTVTGTGEVLPDGTLDLTVTYSPTDEGPHSGSFTVTIGDQTYTITVTGNGLVVNSTLYSAVVDVPVYKTDIEILSPYTMAELEADTSHDLPANVTNSDVNIKVTSNSSAITRYDVYHNVGVKESQENWATGDLNRAVSYASADYDSYVYLPHAKDEDLTSWVQQPSVPMSQNEMWIHLNDYVTVQGNATWYVPVVVANGVQSTGNTYGAPIRSSQVSTMTATVNYDQSDIMTDAATGLQYYYMAAEVAMHCVVPPVDDDADYHYELVLARAWRQWTPYVVGQGALPATETYMGQKEIDGAQTDVIIGCKDFQRDESGRWSYDEPTFCALAGTTPMFVSRFYYQRVPNDASAGAPRRAGGGGGGGGGGAGAPGDGPNPPGNATGLGNFTVDKQIVSVTYVNPLGMTSTSPFDGMNIIVTRYDDGSVQTTKVLK